MNASTTRRQLFGSAAALVGAGAWWWRGMSAPAGALEATSELDAAAVALHAAVRLRLVSDVGFPVQLPGELVLLDNFGDNRLFGSGAHQGIDIGRRDGQPGHPVVACVDGVLVTQEVLGRNQGNSWVLQGANGDAYRYHHLDEFSSDLAVGSAVVRGQVLGTMGSTGIRVPPIFTSRCGEVARSARRSTPFRCCRCRSMESPSSDGPPIMNLSSSCCQVPMSNSWFTNAP